MIDVSRESLSIILDIITKYLPNCEVRVFGSRCGNNAKKYSDLDLSIISTEKLDWLLLAEIREAFQASDLTFRVDILDWHAISPEFRAVIERGYEVIYKDGVGSLQ
ncbi:MAG: nucleotidyltransferase domain-containing protein [bacterium]